MAQALPKPLPIQLRADLFNSLAAMEKAGLPVVKAAATFRLPGTAQARLEKFRQLISRGMDIATAGEKSALFTPLEVSLLRAALYAGSPAITYRRLADRYTQQAQQIANLKSRLLLPLFVLVIALLVQPLPSLVAGTLSGAGYLLQVLRPLVVLLGLYFLARWLKNGFVLAPATPTQAGIVRQLTQTPLFGAMYVRRINRDFFASMALLLEAGISMLEALSKAVETLDNSVIREDFSHIKVRMQQGATLAQAVKPLVYLGNAEVVGYIQTGEGSGTLPEMLLRFADSETAAIKLFQQEFVAWLPRIAYGLIMLWMAYSILSGSAFMPNVPQELQ